MTRIEFEKLCNEFVKLMNNCTNAEIEKESSKSKKNLKKSSHKKNDDLSDLITVGYLPYKRHRKEIETKISPKEIAIQTTAGVIAGVCEIVPHHPLDVVKTRFQVQSSSSSVRYDGLIDCFKKMYKTEGLSSFYKGIIPILIMETPRRALMFVSFEQYKVLLSKYMTDSPNAVYFAAGAASGATDAIILNPFEVVKVVQQTNSAKPRLKSIDVLRQLKNEGGYGFCGLNKGLDATIIRASGYGFAYFGTYFTLISHSPTFSSLTQELLHKVFSGFLAGAAATCLVTPFDVVKSRIQQTQPYPPKYKYLIPTFGNVYKEFGFRGLYQGFLPKVLRLGPGGATLMIVYEIVNTKLHSIYGY